MNIYLTGGWGYGNIGDEAILASTLRSLAQRLDNPKIVLTSFDPSQTYRYHGVKSLPSLHKLLYLRSLRFLPNLLSLLVWALLYRATGRRHLFLTADLRTHVEGMERSDLVIMGGGGYFNDAWWQTLPARLMEIWVPKVLGKKVMIYGQTVGPFSSKLSRVFFGRLLNKVDFVTYRDAASVKTLARYNYDIEGKALLTADEATLVDPEHLNKALLFDEYALDLEKPTVGIMFQHFRPYGSVRGVEPLDRIKTRDEYLKEAEKTILRIYSKHPINILFLPSTTWDSSFCWHLHQLVSAKLGKSNVRFVEGCGVRKYTAFCQNVDVMLSTNMHPIILASTNSVPSIAISYWYKIDNFMESIGRGADVWRIDRIDSEGIACRFDEVVRHRADIASQVREAFERVKARASLNALCAEALAKEQYERLRSFL